jgi:tetratricopeptide (TPR) repeat protein
MKKQSSLPLALVLLTTACITVIPRSAKTSATAKVIPDMPMQRWGTESCGAGSLSTVLEHYGDPRTMVEWDAALPKIRGGVLSIDMLLAARQQGFRAELQKANGALVSYWLHQGKPVILMLQIVDSPGHKYDFFHYVVADGIDDANGLVRLQFGDGKGRWTTFERIENPWAGGGHAALFIEPSSSGQPTVTAEQMLREAVVLEESGRPAEAAAAYRQLIGRSPSALAWTNLGNAESAMAHPDKAEEAFRQALAIDPGYRDALNNLAWLLLQKKELDEAERLARAAALTPGPDKYVVLDTLARVLAARGSCAEAESTFNRAIDSVPPNHPEAKNDLVAALAETRKNCH